MERDRSTSTDWATMPGSYGRRRSSSICASDLQAATSIHRRRNSQTSLVSHRLHGRRRSSSICLSDIMAASSSSSRDPLAFWDSVNHVVVTMAAGACALPLAARTTQRWRARTFAQPQPPSPAQKLPLELVLAILEHACELSKRDAVAVSLVCRRARAVAIPSVYRAVTFSGKGSSLGRFLSLVSYVSGVEAQLPLTRCVRELWTGPHTVPLEVLAQCTGLERLAIEPQSFINYCSSRHEDATRLQSLIDPKFNSNAAQSPVNSVPIFRARELLLLPFPCDWSELDTSNSFTRACLESITHLWLTDPLHVFSSHLRIPLEEFTNLTHLALRVNMPFLIHESDEMETLAYTLDSVRRAVPKLEMIVFVLYCTANCPHTSPRIRNLAQCLSKTDERAHVLPLAGDVNADAVLYPYFKSSSSGEAKLWRRARRFLRDGVPPKPQIQNGRSLDFLRMQNILQVW